MLHLQSRMDEIDSVHNRLFNIENMLCKIINYQQNQQNQQNQHCTSDIDNEGCDCDCRSECNCKEEQEPNQNSLELIKF